MDYDVLRHVILKTKPVNRFKVCLISKLMNKLQNDTSMWTSVKCIHIQFLDKTETLQQFITKSKILLENNINATTLKISGDTKFMAEDLVNLVKKYRQDMLLTIKNIVLDTPDVRTLDIISRICQILCESVESIKLLQSRSITKDIPFKNISKCHKLKKIYGAKKSSLTHKTQKCIIKCLNEKSLEVLIWNIPSFVSKEILTHSLRKACASHWVLSSIQDNPRNFPNIERLYLPYFYIYQLTTLFPYELPKLKVFDMRRYLNYGACENIIFNLLKRGKSMILIYNETTNRADLYKNMPFTTYIQNSENMSIFSNDKCTVTVHYKSCKRWGDITCIYDD